MANQEIKNVKIEDLQLWTENPRDPLDNELPDLEIITRALEDKHDKWQLPKLAKEMGSYYDISELPIVVESGERYIVFDGNRRVAILKYLKNESSFEGFTKLKFKEDTHELRNLDEMPCNVCDMDTALDSIERKHVNNGTWKPLERDYFKHLHRKQKKSEFIEFDESTGLITNNPKLNQRFVKEEFLTKENLKKAGFDYDSKNGFVTNYSQDEAQKVLEGITNLVEKGFVSTRKNRGKLHEPLVDYYPDLEQTVRPYNAKKPSSKLSDYTLDGVTKPAPKKPRKTPVVKENKYIFGRTLTLEPGKVNNLYSAIKSVYERNRTDEKILPIIGMSLRLLLETAARVHYKDDPKVANDQIYSTFLKDAKKDMKSPNKKPQQNFLSLTSSWLSGSTNLDGILGKFAHGNITPSEHDILEQSKIIGDILEFYFKKKV